MNRRMIARLATAIVFLWAVVGVLSWSLYDPADRLVAAKPRGESGADTFVFAPRDLQPTLKRIHESYVWGPPAVDAKAKQAQEAAEKVVEWRVLATRISGIERSLLIEIDKKKLEYVMEGGVLPDGRLVKSVMPSGYTLESAEGELITTKIYF